MKQKTERPVERVDSLAKWLIDNEVLKSVYAFEHLCDLSNHYIKNLSGSEKGNPGVDVIAKIYEAIPLLNLEWLVTGKGKMFKVKGTDDEVADAIRKRLLARLI